jgi:F-type H+-transporting ATPase subunit epsilon
MYVLKIVTPTRELLKGENIEEVFVPGHRGELNILPGHAPLVTTLRPGILKYRTAGSSDFNSMVISWGYCEVHPTGVTILAETAETAQEVDKARAEQALKTAIEKLSGQLTSDQFEKYQRKAQRAQARLDILKQ